jgi:WD40 repeat protein
MPVGPVLDPRGGGVVSTLDWAPGGEQLYGAAANGKVVVWETSGRPTLGRLVRGVGTDGGLLSPDGKVIAAVGTEPEPALGTPQTITLVDARTGRTMGAPVGVATALAFGRGRDGPVLALARADGALAVIDVATRRDVFAPRAQPVPIAGLAFSPDGATISVGRGDGSVVLVDASTGETRGAPLTGHDTFVPWSGFKPDGTVMITSSVGGGSLAWDLTRSPPVPSRLSDEQSLQVLSAVFSPDGELVATGSTDGRVAIRDGDTLERMGPPTVGPGVIAPIGFTSDGSVLATSGDDRTVRLYDVATRQQIGVPFPKSSVYGTASLSADGRVLVTSGGIGLVIWDTDARSWARRACSVAGRNLTRAEWERFLPDTRYRRTCEQWPSA